MNEEQEPIARVTGVHGGRFIVEPLNSAMVLPTDMALYSRPRPEQDPNDLTIAYMSGFHDGKKKREWVGLTDQEVDEAWQSVNWQSEKGLMELRRDYAFALETKLKEKNGVA